MCRSAFAIFYLQREFVCATMSRTGLKESDLRDQKLVGMSVDLIVEQALGRCGLDVIEAESFREGLGIFVKGMAASPGISTEGRNAIQEICIATLVARLGVEHWMRRHPEAKSSAIESPVFILGAPRTGTTLVSNLLAQDPARRALLRWEASSPAPPAAPGALYTDRRCTEMKLADATALTAHNVAPAIHHEEADGPTECLLMLGLDFKSMLFESLVDNPAYSDWILHTGMASAYECHRMVLQMLQHHNPGKWTLKMPSHAVFIRHMLNAYPDARIIRTHRDPYKAIASLCSLIESLRRQFGEVDPLNLGPAYIEHFVAHLQRPTEVNATLSGGTILDVHYADMIRDPMSQMRRIYEWLQEPFTPVVETRMLHWLAVNPPGRFGRHAYGLERFGLTEAMLSPYFGGYVEQYEVASEGVTEHAS